MALFKKKTAGRPGEWYYCLKHQKVEEGPECRAADRFGPYQSREEAAHAMETAQARNLEWDTDRRWHDDADDGADDDSSAGGGAGEPDGSGRG